MGVGTGMTVGNHRVIPVSRVPLFLDDEEQDDRTRWRCLDCGTVFVGFPDEETPCPPNLT